MLSNPKIIIQFVETKMILYEFISSGGCYCDIYSYAANLILYKGVSPLYSERAIARRATSGLVSVIDLASWASIQALLEFKTASRPRAIISFS